MPATRPPIASCPHCGTILLWTQEGLVHPMPGERERIRSTLGMSWFAHATTPFDGRFHHCLGSVRQSVLWGSRGGDEGRRKRPA
ncbi:MAG: hypothetical protein P4L84_31830 [Isosphaeraceae bacterium]|nr:hypothetical protein [Isosphaeraceae bacterium]